MEGLYSFVFQKYTFFHKKEKATYYKQNTKKYSEYNDVRKIKLISISALSLNPIL